MSRFSGPCKPWAEPEDVRGCDPFDDIDKFPDTQIEDMLESASYVLYMASGQQFAGCCSHTVRPVYSSDCGCWSSGDDSLAEDRLHVAGGMPDLAGRRLGRGRRSILLGSSPVVNIAKVTIDGVVLPSNEYRIDESKYLTRLRDSEGRAHVWPGWQDMTLPTTEDGTFEVQFVAGQAPPQAGVIAARALARELLLSSCNSDQCQLDRRVQSLTRQGITIQLPGLVDVIKEGRTGISEVDLFLWASNPNGLRRRARVLTPTRRGTARHAGR